MQEGVGGGGCLQTAFDHASSRLIMNFFPMAGVSVICGPILLRLLLLAAAANQEREAQEKDYGGPVGLVPPVVVPLPSLFPLPLEHICTRNMVRLRV